MTHASANVKGNDRMHASFAIQRILAADAQCVERGSHQQKDLLELELTCLRVILPIAESLVSQKAPMTCRHEICTRMSGWILTLRVSSQGIMSMAVEKHEAGARWGCNICCGRRSLRSTMLAFAGVHAPLACRVIHAHTLEW